MAIINVPNGKLPAIITHLEMLAKPEIENTESSLSIALWTNPEPTEYLSLFRAIGEEWLWLSRLLMDEATLLQAIRNPDTKIFLVKDGRKNTGMIELDFSQPGQCEIVFFGLTPEQAGQGHGRWLMSQALKQAWQKDVKRVWLHTCSLDAPHALSFYQKFGFRAFKREIETMDDPRLSGHIRKDAAAHIPVIS